MSYLDKQRCAAMDSLPVLPRGLFRLHNFYDVDAEAMAEGLIADVESILLCLAEAPALIHRHNPNEGPDRFDSEKAGLPIAQLETRLRREYRERLESNFAESGYAGNIEWPDPFTDITADEEAAAAFVISFLSRPLRVAEARSRRTNIATVDLWRFAPPWRRLLRRRLSRITDAVRCAGWVPFDVWLANQIAPNRHYPHGYVLYQRRRRPLPDETIVASPAQKENCAPQAPSEAQRRFNTLPSLTQDAYLLFDHYGRSIDEISMQLGVGRRSVNRRIRRAIYAIGGWPLPSLVRTIGFELEWRWERLKRQCRSVLIALRD